jgi:folate-dependent phosphoribosylglycinamide formyltransferase PurN
MNEQETPQYENKKIQFTRKLVHDDNLAEFLKIVESETMISGNAVHMVISDLQKLKILCKGAVEAYKAEDMDLMSKIIQMMEVIL